MLREDAEEQQCLVVLLHAVPSDFTHDQLPDLPKWLAGVVCEQLLDAIATVIKRARTATPAILYDETPKGGTFN